MSKTHRPLTVIALMSSAFMSAMEMTVVSTAMPTVISELGGIEIYAWVFTAYIVASTVSVPLFGKVADLYGRKPVMLVGIALFLIGSCASGLAQSMPQLIAARVLQGIGAGAMQPVSMTIIGDLFTASERARMQGVFGAVWGVAGLVGPLVGGLIVKSFSWRWVFYVNVPFGLCTAAILVIAFHERVERHQHRLDILGAVLLAISVIALLTVGHGSTWALPVSVVAFALFLFNESRAKEPILPLALFKSRVMSVSSAAGALIGGAMMSTMTFIPLFVQGVLGGSPTDAGLAVAPMAIGWPIASALGGRLLPRVGYRPLVRAGFLLTLASALILALLLKPGASPSVPKWTTALLGLGLGFANTTLLIAVQTSVSWNQRGVATASTMLFRTLGGALAVGGMGGVLAASLSANGSFPAQAANRLLGPTHGRDLDPALLRGLSGALASGLGRVFWIIVGVAAAAFLVSLLFPRLHVEKDKPSAAAGEGAARGAVGRS